jgi:hypothetical protein
MGTKPFPRNERCPCGSRQKYKHCCFQKGFTYQLDDETGEVILRGLRLAQGIAERKSTMPMLNNVLLRTRARTSCWSPRPTSTSR